MDKFFEIIFSLFYILDFRSEYFDILIIEDMLTTIGMLNIAAILAVQIAYYKILDKPSHNYLRYYFIVGIIGYAISFLIVLIYLYNKFEGLEDYADISGFFHFEFCLTRNLVGYSLLYFLLSLVVKRFSINLRNIPFKY